MGTPNGVAKKDPATSGFKENDIKAQGQVENKERKMAFQENNQNNTWLMVSVADELEFKVNNMKEMKKMMIYSGSATIFQENVILMNKYNL